LDEGHSGVKPDGDLSETNCSIGGKGGNHTREEADASEESYRVGEYMLRGAKKKLSGQNEDHEDMRDSQ